MLTSPETGFAARTKRFRSGPIREILRATQVPERISFAGGLPAPELFPVADVAAAAARVAEIYGPVALQYSLTEGVPQLRTWLAERLSARMGVSLTADDVIITGGSQQAIDLYAKLYLEPGDAIVVENPAYMGALQAFDAFEASYIPVETDTDGIIPEALEATLANARTKPKFVYLTPTYQNPSAVTLSERRRGEVVAICDRYEIPILEDDPYGDIYFEDRPLRPLFGYPHHTPNVYIGTGSKMVAPGLRIGWAVITDPVVREMFLAAKLATDLHTCSYSQYVFYEYVRGAELEVHLAKIREVYGHRRDVMRDALRECIPEAQYAVPGGGMFFWATVPNLDTEALFPLALAQDVVFVPGRVFYPNRDRGDGMRLNFSNAGDERIRTGISRLAGAIAKLAQSPAN